MFTLSAPPTDATYDGGSHDIPIEGALDQLRLVALKLGLDTQCRCGLVVYSSNTPKLVELVSGNPVTERKGRIFPVSRGLDR